MPPCQSTLAYNSLAPSDLEESSPHGVGGSFIEISQSNSEEMIFPATPDSAELLGVSSADELDGIQEEERQEHMVVEESIALARLEEATVHRVVEDSFESLREDRVRAWLRAKKPNGKKDGRAMGYP